MAANADTAFPVTRRTGCRLCDGALKTILDLGTQSIIHFPLPGDPPGLVAPLDWCQCMVCGFVQLRHTVRADYLYRDYWYQSGVTRTMRAHLAEIVQQAIQEVDLQPGDTVLDIGANDWTLLDAYPTLYNLTRIGCDPAPLAVDLLARLTERDHVIWDYFSADKMPSDVPKPKIITSIAMFYDLDDPGAFVEDIQKTLHEDGVWIVEMLYLPAMLRHTAFDAICHEHLGYYNARQFDSLCAEHNLNVTDAIGTPINGGSFRYIVRHAEHVHRAQKRETDILSLLRAERDEEREENLFSSFLARYYCEQHNTLSYLSNLYRQGKTVAVLGASTKGLTLLQSWNIDHRHIAFASERDPHKWGREYGGTRIPIVSEDEVRERKPDAMLVLPWHFADEITQREQEYVAQGGKLIFPLPECHVVSR